MFFSLNPARPRPFFAARKTHILKVSQFLKLRHLYPTLLTSLNPFSKWFPYMIQCYCWQSRNKILLLFIDVLLFSRYLRLFSQHSEVVLNLCFHVHVFQEGPKKWWNLHRRFDVYYTANIYRMVIGNFIGNPLSAYRILPIGTNTL